mmetsp:Transcript_38845/g.93019  ORF Transcript_38845/g.93019 Transcript_38845/m.93019 type:complete len:221 (+) Transcript_38845:140-802(+)
MTRRCTAPPRSCWAASAARRSSTTSSCGCRPTWAAPCPRVYPSSARSSPPCCAAASRRWRCPSSTPSPASARWTSTRRTCTPCSLRSHRSRRYSWTASRRKPSPAHRCRRRRSTCSACCRRRRCRCGCSSPRSAACCRACWGSLSTRRRPRAAGAPRRFCITSPPPQATITSSGRTRRGCSALPCTRRASAAPTRAPSCPRSLSSSTPRPPGEGNPTPAW